MLPVLFKLGPLTIHTYGFLLALGVGFALWFMYSQAKKAGLNASRLLDVAFYTILISLAGAKLILFVANFSYYTKHPGELLSLARSGGVFQGGLAFGVIFALWFMNKHKIPVWKTADIAGPAVALGHAFGRIGCFSAGCCYGTECSLPWAVEFHNEYASGLTGLPLGISLHPTQLYEAGLNFLNFMILFLALKKKRFEGQVFALYIINYSVIRYFTEFYRGDHPDKTYVFQNPSPYLSLSFPQLFSLFGLAAGIILFILLKKRKGA